ncbi:UNVERIFIED_CONTAM: hypothetical protein GTU68_046492, partial [Idotea baltica]|nr:hypothetical protein [Idotea baltica]
VTWYNCGPTVYDSAHIGHALCFVRLDIIKRILQDIFHLNVVQVTGITDVDDKIIARTKELNTCVQTLTQKYEKEFFKDMAKLNVLPPSIAPRVTEHIPQILSFVAKIMEKGLAYDVGQGTVYFDTESYGRYGKLVKQNEKEIIQIFSDSRKKSIRDFVLWKGAAKDDCITWDSPWGPGRPGWHIECSAMASRFFGEELDLHSGGIDLLFPHHENEEAQCCAHHTRDQWCNYWIHTGHLHIKGNTKMSKSLYNTISIQKFLEEHSANTFRLYCLFSHYRNCKYNIGFIL